MHKPSSGIESMIGILHKNRKCQADAGDQMSEQSEQSEQKEDVSQERKTDRDFAEQIIQANNAAKQAELDRLKVINENHEEEIAALKVQLQENREAIDRIDQLLSQTEEYTHTTGVRIYRNVQASFMEEQSKQTAVLLGQMKEQEERMDDLLRRSKKKGRILLLVLILLAVLGNTALFVLHFYFHIF